ncbi:hypothetical protein J4212_01045 [Candidatus Woesearchaeota archaeon]|nr:hypothetical protein [Candidatus Woesearchaeota archaeon]
MRGSKAQIEDWLPLLFIIVFLVLLMLLFSLLGSSRQRAMQKGFEADKAAIGADTLLTNYALYPLSSQKGEMSIGAAIGLYDIWHNNDQLRKIESSTAEFFSKSQLENDNMAWMIAISYPGRNDIYIYSEKAANRLAGRSLLSSIKIPASDEKDTITISLLSIRSGQALT